MPLASCPLFRACGPQVSGAIEDLAIGLVWSVGIWLALFLWIGMGRR